MSCGAVHRNSAGVALRTDGVGGETLTVGNVVDVDLLILADVGSFQQGVVYRARPFIMQFGLGYEYAVQLRLQHGSLH